MEDSDDLLLSSAVPGMEVDNGSYYDPYPAIAGSSGGGGGAVAEQPSKVIDKI